MSSDRPPRDLFNCVYESTCANKVYGLAAKQCNSCIKSRWKKKSKCSNNNIRTRSTTILKKNHIAMKAFACLNGCETMLTGPRRRSCLPCVKKRYSTNKLICSKNAYKMSGRQKRISIEDSEAYGMELARILPILEEAGRQFSKIEFTPRYCKMEGCKSVSILADPYCTNCWTGLGYTIRKSGLGSNSGLGLFTERTRNNHEMICLYTGWIRQKDSWDMMQSKASWDAYTLEGDERMIVAHTSAGGIGRYINDTRCGMKNNAAFIQVFDEDGTVVSSQVKIEFTKKVQKGAEVFISYGRLYKF